MGILVEAFSPVIPIFIIIFMIIVVVTLFINIKSGYQLDTVSKKLRCFSIIGLIMSLVGIFLVTLMPTSNESDIVVLTPLESIKDMWYYATTEAIINSIVMNIVLFIPISFFLYCLIKRYFNSITVLSLINFIETTQYLLPIGRVTSVDDVMLNSIGGIIGVFWLLNFKKQKCLLPYVSW